MENELKSLKISEPVHYQLKVYCAQDTAQSMTKLADFAILVELKNRGHKFIKHKKKQPCKQQTT